MVKLLVCLIDLRRCQVQERVGGCQAVREDSPHRQETSGFVGDENCDNFKFFSGQRDGIKKITLITIGTIITIITVE